MKIPRLLAGALSLLTVVATSTAARAQSFTHPGISHPQADLDRMRNNVNVEPYKTAYGVFSGLSFSQSTNTGQGPFTSEYQGHGQFEIRNDAQVAHYNAVMWYVTGNTAYRTNAINIMMGWANTMTSFDQSDIITAATAIFDFCNAAEIIRATGNGAWAAADITTFQSWMITYLYPPLLLPGGSIAANHLTSNGFGGLQMKGLLALGIFCDRQDMFNFGVSSLQHNGTYTYGLQEYVNASSGQNYENQRDQGHASGNIGTFTESFYMAYNQGTDLFPYASSLLAKAFETQAKFDLGWDVAPASWTAADGTAHNDINSDSRQPTDNLTSDLTYYIYHTVKGLAMPYTCLSSNAKFAVDGLSFMYRVDNSGTVPLSPFLGQPADNDVAVFGNGLYSGWIAHFTAGNYPSSTFASHGASTAQASSIRVPAGWSVTVYSGDNYTGNSATLTANQPNLGSIGFNDNVLSIKVTSGGTYTVANGTYKIANRNSGKVADVSGGSTADGASVVPSTYTSANSQLWRVESLGSGQYRFLDINSNKAMEVSGASTTSGALIDQRTYVPPPNLASGGTASASSDNSANGQGAAQAFDGNVNTKWITTVSGAGGSLQYKFATGTTWAVNRYVITSADDVPDRDPAVWQFQGSNDGSTWTTLDIRTGQTFAGRQQSKTYNITNTAAYTYYRLNVTATAAVNNYLQLAELALYSTKTGGVQQRWTFAANPGSAYGTQLILHNVNSGQVLDGSGTSTLVQKPEVYPSASYAQQWLLQVP